MPTRVPLRNKVRARCLEDRYYEAAKKIQVYVNGDQHKRPKLFTVPKSKVKGPEAMEVFMTQMTDSLRNNFHLRSAIRHLFTPEGGTRIKKLEQLKDRGVYIASTKAKLEKADYSKNHSPPKKPRLRNIHTTYSKLRRDSEIYVKPVKHWDKAAEHYRKTPTDLRSHYKDSLSYYQTIKESTKPHIKTLYIFANGDTHRYYSVILRGKLASDEKDTECFQKILNQISTTVGRAQTRDRGSLAVRRLYNLDGKRVKTQRGLHDGMAYICVGDTKLKRLPYGSEHSMNPQWKSTIKPMRTTSGAISVMGDSPRTPRTPYPDSPLPPIKTPVPQMATRTMNSPRPLKTPVQPSAKTTYAEAPVPKKANSRTPKALKAPNKGIPKGIASNMPIIKKKSNPKVGSKHQILPDLNQMRTEAEEFDASQIETADEQTSSRVSGKSRTFPVLCVVAKQRIFSNKVQKNNSPSEFEI
ncbi:Oidioi.mRNA.OKI2018_I69.PAR.g10786.t1.cds [Oikopleura dioica]|uniref:Oidioi.mRNA.OKI2018_I69.PAR.g10786.t1.cds n=1 Tax=Oikopleura dioica TaxID=34765 RepID=A0ABN7RSC9_OIKDI|nr:Oidioi.mRNA.OKI2018_I69.PAR.g10786.t1.cds [Oikopleura dioica]